MEVWIIRNPLSDGSETFDVRVAEQGVLIDFNAVDGARAFELKAVLLADVNGIQVIDARQP
jgi:hypothetical protein